VFSEHGCEVSCERHVGAFGSDRILLPAAFQLSSTIRQSAECCGRPTVVIRSLSRNLPGGSPCAVRNQSCVHVTMSKTHVSKYKTVARYDFSDLYRQVALQHRASIHKRVEFPVLAAGSIPGGKSERSCLLNSLPTNSGARTLLSIQVSFARTPDLIMESASSRVGSPHTGKIGCNPEFSSSLLAVCPYVRREEIAKGNVFDARQYSGFARFAHDAVVIRIRARPRQIHIPQRNACRFCLRFDEATTHRMHSNPVSPPD